MPETTTEVLPCPFCGGSVFIRAVWPTNWVSCKECAACGPSSSSSAKAIAAHNAIASAVADRDRLTAENESLRAQVGQLREAGQHLLDVSEPFHRPTDLVGWGSVDNMRAALAATAPTQEAPDA